MIRSIFNLGTGLFTGGTVTADAGTGLLEQNTPPGHAAIQGIHDHRNRRVDLATGEVVDWQPPQPPDTDDWAYTWDADLRLWVARPTPAAVERERRKRIAAQMAAIELQQARPTRELLLDPANRHALAKLQYLEGQLDDLRWQMNTPPPSTTKAPPPD